MRREEKLWEPRRRELEHVHVPMCPKEESQKKMWKRCVCWMGFQETLVRKSPAAFEATGLTRPGIM